MFLGPCATAYPLGYVQAIPFERIPSTVLFGSNAPMNIKALRRANLLRLIASKFDGNKAAFARAIDRPAPNVHRMLADGDSDKRGIGEDLARDIERKCSLPPMWLDSDPAGSTWGDLNTDVLLAASSRVDACIRQHRLLPTREGYVGALAYVYKEFMQQKEVSDAAIQSALAGMGVEYADD